MSSPPKDLRHASWPHALERTGKTVRDALAASLRPLFTLMAQQLVEAVAPLLSSSWSELKRVIEAILPPPGTLDGDILILFAGRPDDEREAALERLAPHFPRSAVFHPERWRLLKDKYREYETSLGAPPWPHLIRSGLLVACSNLSGDLTFDQVPRELRKEVRKAIERALLDGYTLDERMARHTVLLPDTPELLVEEGLSGTLSELEDMLSLQGALAKLTVDELRLLDLMVRGYTLAGGARRLGISSAAARQRWRRLRKKILRSDVTF